FIEKSEMQRMVQVLNFPGKALRQVDLLFDQYDTENTGKITRTNFLKAMRTVQVPLFKAVKADVDAALHRASQIDNLDEKPISLVVEGGFPSALSEILEIDGNALPGSERAELRESFFRLAGICKSVVACRCTPHQKALIIREMKRRKGACVAAIGDGGNDEPMIKEADAADFAIGQFRFLHPLLFKHGIWLYDRIAIMTLYIFYKAAMVALAMFYFGFFSGFSAHQLFNLWAYTLYNVFFTAAPILCVAILDQTLLAKTLENQPLAYRACITRGQLFSTRIFFVWIQQAMVHTALIFFIAFWALEYDVIFPDGKVHGLWTTASVIYAVIVMVATFRLTLEMRSFTYCHHFWLWFSFVGFWISMIILNLLPTFNPDMYWVVFKMLASPQIWLTIILCTSLPIILDLMVYGIKADMFPHYHQLLREREQLDKLDIAPTFESFIFRQRKLRKVEKVWVQSYEKERKAMELEKERTGVVVPEVEDKSIKKRDAIVLAWLRFQNMSGANFDGTDDAEHVEIDRRAKKGEEKVSV
ncbi:hypothetical protein AAMO2058_001000500, partial [Amorphochlora amoebiformis]